MLIVIQQKIRVFLQGGLNPVIRFFTRYDWPTYIGFFLVSLSILSFEVIINRMFALMFWYHFAFMIISVGLFGIGVGGMLVYFTNKFLKDEVPVVLTILSILLAFSFPLILLNVNNIPLNMDLLGKDEIHNALFIKLFLTLSIPFIISGFIFSFVFTNFKNDISRIYFFDLVGGGVGAIAVLGIFPHRGPFLTAFILSVIVVIAAAAFIFKRNKVLALLLLPIIIVFQVFYIYPKVQNIDIRVSKGGRKSEVSKETGRAERLEEIYGKRVFADWDNFGFVAVHSHGGKLNITADYSCYTPIIPVDKKIAPKYLQYGFFADHDYPYIVKKNPGIVGIVGVGGGKDIIQALARNAKEIYGAEFNKTIFNLYNSVYADYIGGIPRLPNVHVVKEEGRFFIRSSDRKYDVLVFDNAVAQTAVSSGAFTIAESYIYTVEAMIDYLEHLSEGGVVYFSNPYIDAERFTPIIREAFRRLDRADGFKNSVFLADNHSGNYRKCKVLIKNGEFTKQESAALTHYAESLGHEVLYSPYKSRNTYINKLVIEKDIDLEYLKSLSDIRPSVDDWPFFTQRMKPEMQNLNRKMWELKQFYPEPFIMLRKATKDVGFYALIFLVLPLLFLNLKGFADLHNKIGSIIYFMSLGLGFMLLEIVLMQKYMLILGHPVYSFCIVLAGLLISSGIGSLISDFFESPYKAIVTGLAGITAATLISFLFSKFLGHFIVGFPFALRIIIVLILISANGFFMGFMMPSGIKAISKVESAIPWMWSINSVFSVVASFISIYLSILYGYSIVLLVAVCAYAIGTGFFLLKRA